MSRISPLDLVPDHVRRFDPYRPSPPDRVIMRLFGLKSLTRLHNNENHLGPPLAAKALLEGFPTERVAQYPNGDCFTLRHALARRFQLDAGQFLVGNGSCEIISSLTAAFCQLGDNIITADKTFAVYEWVASFSGVTPRLAPLRDFAFDPEALLSAMDHHTKIIFVCNPNNPTGSFWNAGQVADFLDRVAGRAVVVLDEAYIEYVDRPDSPRSMELLAHYPNLVVFRTFSKMYGLAGLRVGYLAASAETADIIRRVHTVYSVNILAQETALAALSDDAGHIAASRETIAQARRFLIPVLSGLGLAVQAGEGNFLMFRAPCADTLLHRHLLKRGVMVRAMTAFRFPGWIRLTLGPLPMMEAFALALTETLADLKKTRAR